MACRRPGVAAVCVRSRAPVCGRPASRRRSRLSERQPCARPGGRNRLVRRDRADRRQDGVDRDRVRLHRHARPSRVDRSGARDSRRRRLARRDGRAERCIGVDAALCVFRHSGDERSAGVRRSAEPAASPSVAFGEGGRGARRRGCAGVRRSCGRGRTRGGYARDANRSGAGRPDKRGEQRLGASCAAEPGGDGSGGGDADRADDREPRGVDDSVREVTGRRRRGVRVRCTRRAARRACRLVPGEWHDGDAIGSRGPRSEFAAGGPRPARDPRRSFRRPNAPLAASGDVANPCAIRRQLATPGGSRRCRNGGRARTMRPSAPEAARHAPYHGFR